MTKRKKKGKKKSKRKKQKSKKSKWCYNPRNKMWVKRTKGKKGFTMRKKKPKGA